ncbi:MAG: hypothetical protein KC621_35075, partial [Myxococcales bacterium]|nr:hypothetical protein [Myxococcales bacterium]
QELTGLDGSNPLGFLAAIGVLRWLASGPEPQARLSFRDGSWTAVLHDAPPVQDWAPRAADDANASTTRPHLAFSYTKKEAKTEAKKDAKTEAKKNGEVHDLKPPPDVFRQWLLGLRSEEDMDAMSFALAYAAERGLDASTGKVIKPTALHFTAGQQQFLGSVQEIAASVTTEDILEALHGPWRYGRAVKSLSWDATSSRNYALRATDPSKEKRLGNPGADWFAFLALPLFPVVSKGTQALTTCAAGSWKRGWFRWPLWSVPASLETISDLVLLPDLERWSARERLLRGVSVVFRSDIGRSDQGGYGSFGPARIA